MDKNYRKDNGFINSIEIFGEKHNDNNIANNAYKINDFFEIKNIIILIIIESNIKSKRFGRVLRKGDEW